MHTRKARKNKSWARTSSLDMSQEHTVVCSNVKYGKAFSQPVALTVRVEGSLKTYHACPHCFSRVSVSDNSRKRLKEAPLGALKKALEETANSLEENKPVGCAHFIGYLKKRPKGSPIPDECLTCAAIMKCM